MKHLITLGVLLRETGRIEGRKKFQKIVHILQEGGVDFDASFEFSRFGPYSIDLRTWIDDLVQSKLVIETEVGQSFHYEATEKFETLLSKLGAASSPTWKSVAVELNKIESTDLEGISTIMFLQSRGWSGRDLAERFASLKKHLSDRFDEYSREAQRLHSAITAVA